MIHLPIHLANELRLGGPVQFRWMYPPERYMFTLKSYVRNKSRPEGCIAEAYLVEECLNFCSRYLHEGVKTRFNKKSRNDDDPNPIGMETSNSFPNLFPNKGRYLGAKKGDPFTLDDNSLSQVHGYILNNCDDIEEYIREHEHEVNNQRRGSKWNKAKSHSQNFPRWFETRAMHDDVPYWIKELSRGPNAIAKRYSGYCINGYIFHTRQRDARHKTQNSGVTLDALTTSFASSKDTNPVHANVTYYGRLIDIVELDYYGNFSVVLFKCDWYESGEDGYGDSYVHFNKKCSLEEPFVLASQAHQCFYVQDPFDKNKHYVRSKLPRDLFNMGDKDDNDGHVIYENEPSNHSRGPSIPNDDGEVNLVRNDLPEMVVDVSQEFLFSQEYQTEPEDDSFLEDSE